MSADPALLGSRRLGAANPATGRHKLWTTLMHGRGLVGVVLVGVVVVLGLFGPLLAPYSPTQQLIGLNLVGPGPGHWLGTDQVNRDIATRTLYGIRVDLVVVFLAVPAGALLGGFVGLTSSLVDVADVVTQRVFDLVLAFPTLILAIALTAFMGPGVTTVAVVIIVSEIPVFGRQIRTSARLVRELPYVESARVIGAGQWWLMRRHILPNSMEPLIVQLALSMSVAVFIEGAMSFLGIGVRPPHPSLGSLIKDGTRNIYDSPSFAVGPLVVVVALVLGFLLIAQALSRARVA
jgi:peptide/nickel transport system permease protein